MAVSLVVPDRGAVPHTLAVALPGGGYSRRYWDIDWPGEYSQADYHARRGWLFAAVDHLGLGASTPVDPALLTIDLMARTIAAVTADLAAWFRQGSMAEFCGPLPITRVIGIGQSMGACVSLVSQARYRPFDGLAVLGFSASHAILPLPGTGTPLLDVELLGQDAAALAWCYHHDDVISALRAADLEGGFPFRTGVVPPWGCSTIPAVAPSIMAPGFVAADAARVEVPVFVGLGDRDVSADATSEPACYSCSPEVTLAVIRTMAHMHNFAGTRRRMWRRLHDWGEGLGPAGR